MKSFDSINNLKLTCGELATALAHLGFVGQNTAKKTVFLNKKTRHPVHARQEAPTAEVYHLDLMGITFHLAYKNLIGEREELWKLVNQQKSGQAAPA